MCVLCVLCAEVCSEGADIVVGGDASNGSVWRASNNNARVDTIDSECSTYTSIYGYYYIQTSECLCWTIPLMALTSLSHCNSFKSLVYRSGEPPSPTFPTSTEYCLHNHS